MKKYLKILIVCIFVTIKFSYAADGSKENPFNVLLVPADGGTEEGTILDFQPIFNALTKATKYSFNIIVGQSYSAVVEGICSGLADFAWFGPVTYIQARERGCVELLAVEVRKGSSVYYSGIFAKKDDISISSLEDLKNKKVAFGDINSTSSFVFPMAMLIDAGINPILDLAKSQLTGSHANSLKSLQAGIVDAAASSFNSYEKAVKQGSIDKNDFKVIAKSDSIPNPPLAMSIKLPDSVKIAIKNEVANLHKNPEIKKGMLRGYGGKKVDYYDINITDEDMLPALKKMALINNHFKLSIIEANSN
ncbi:MAG: phosphate/phosphite/phosphonate ABC transporter substrate-binding protein [Alphaproteobacteria bacterium]|nr:phosphate/phosphite/phosphonate ABC transporter substrate-binding protein [Alphaproteobacteria bacterium]